MNLILMNLVCIFILVLKCYGFDILQSSINRGIIEKKQKGKQAETNILLHDTTGDFQCLYQNS